MLTNRGNHQFRQNEPFSFTPLLLIGCLAVSVLCSPAASASYASGVEPYSHDLSWYDTWAREQQAVERSTSSSRKLLQLGGGYWTSPAKHNGSTSCEVHLVGTNKQWGVKSASINCTTTDSAWLRSKTGNVKIFAGAPIYSYSLAHPKNFIGVTLFQPPAPFPFNESMLFFTQIGKIQLTGSVTNMHVVDWATMHVENATDATFTNFTFTGNVGQRFPNIAAARSKLTINNCTFTKNVCTNPTRCHTAGVYVTEGERLTLTNSTFTGNKGNLAGALMITSGAVATVTGNTFIQNSTPNFGNFGGAIFNDWCMEARTNGSNTLISNNSFINNFSNGFGGAIRLGSPGAHCPNTVIMGNSFVNNTASVSGGAIFASYCAGQRPYFPGNVFSNNTARQFPGQIGVNALTIPIGEAPSFAAVPLGAGCKNPNTKASNFTGANSKWGKPWCDSVYDSDTS